MEKRNRSLWQYSADVTESSFVFLFAFLTSLHSGVLKDGETTISLALASLSATLYAAVKKTFEKPAKPIVVQAFEQMETTAQEEALRAWRAERP